MRHVSCHDLLGPFATRAASNRVSRVIIINTNTATIPTSPRTCMRMQHAYGYLKAFSTLPRASRIMPGMRCESFMHTPDSATDRGCRSANTSRNFVATVEISSSSPGERCPKQVHVLFLRVRVRVCTPRWGWKHMHMQTATCTVPRTG